MPEEHFAGTRTQTRRKYIAKSDVGRCQAAGNRLQQVRDGQKGNDKSCDSSELFRGLNIIADCLYETYRNRCDVIFLNIQQFLRNAGELEKIRYWYDGYRLEEGLHVYNPKSVIDGMQSRKLKSFWTRMACERRWLPCWEENNKWLIQECFKMT